MNLPAPEQSANGTKFNPFLKANHISAKGKTKVILTGNIRTGDGNFGPQVIAEVKVGKTMYDWSLGLKSGNYRRLFEEFGSNTKKWKGPVMVERDKYLGNSFIKVVE